MGIPVWFDWDGEVVRMFVGKDTPKVHRLRRDPKASVLVNHIDEPERWVAFDGLVSITEPVDSKLSGSRHGTGTSKILRSERPGEAHPTFLLTRADKKMLGANLNLVQPTFLDERALPQSRRGLQNATRRNCTERIGSEAA